VPILKNYIEGTQLNQLRYSSYNSGRGPIVQKKIPTGISERGNEFTQAGKRADDLARIAALMTRPEGLRYLSNEKGLSQVRIKGQAQSQGKQTLLGRLVGGTLNTVKVLGSTLLQVPVNGTGLHFVKGFGERAGYLEKSFAGIVKEGGSAGPSVIGGRYWGRKVGSQYPQFTPDDVVGPIGPVRAKTFKQFEKEKFHLEQRIGLGNISGRTAEERVSPYEKKPQFDKIDKKNFLSPSRTALSEGFDQQAQKPGEARDLVKFNFEVITPGESGGKPISTFLYFRALIDSFNDSYSSNWSEFNYMGRGESFYNYLNFKRDVTVDFKVAAMTRHELAPIYRKLNYLASSLAPTYNKDGFMRGTFTRLTLGSYFYKLPGFITNLTYNWNTVYPFEIALNSPDPITGERENDTDVQELPMVLDVSLNYTPIHTFTPQTGYYHYTTNDKIQPFFKGNGQFQDEFNKDSGVLNNASSNTSPAPDLGFNDSPNLSSFSTPSSFSLNQGNSGFNII